jgi:hypothetical protein
MAMTPGEASRQYQLALEAERTTIDQLGDCRSCEDELDQASAEVTAAYRQLRDTLNR